jgi:hypothetical protein
LSLVLCAAEFFADKKTAGIDRKVQQCIERASSRSAWMRRDAQVTLAWLRAFSNKPATLK